MRVLLLGGTGAIGSELSLSLRRLGADVYVTSRSVRKANDSVTYIQGNAKDLHFLHDLFQEKWDAIIDFMNYALEELRERLDLLLNSTDSYFFLSSSRVYADSKSSLINESSPLLLDTETNPEYLASNEYGLAKAKEEALFHSSTRKNWTILRPYIIYSAARFQLGALEKEDWLQRVLLGKNIVLQKSLCDKLTTLTSSKDAADIMANLILTAQTHGQTYNIVGGKSCQMTWGEVAKVYQSVLQRKLGRVIEIVYLTDHQSRLLRKENSYYQTEYDRMYNRIFDNAKIRKYLPRHDFIAVEQGVEEALSQFLLKPQFSFINLAQEALIDRFTGDFMNLFRIPGLKNKLVYTYFRLVKSH